VKTRGLPSDYYPPDLEPVPRVADLAKLGEAVVLQRDAKGEPSIFRLLPAGTARLGAVMRRNAERCRAWRESA